MSKSHVFDALNNYAQTWSRPSMRKEYVEEECRHTQSHEDGANFPPIASGDPHLPVRRTEESRLKSYADAGFVSVQESTEESKHSVPRTLFVQADCTTAIFAEHLYDHLPSHVRNIWYRNLLEIQDDPLAQYEESLADLKNAQARGLFLLPRPEENADIAAHACSEASEEVLWDVLADEGASTVNRVDALNELISVNADNVAQFVVAELGRSELLALWRNSLILAAETLQLADQQLREILMKRLYELGSSLRHSTEAGIKPVVLSAIRCYASMIHHSEADSLRMFLEPPHPVETRLVTLQSVVHLFEVKPPENPEPLRLLADRIYNLANKFLDKDLLVPGEKAAIGQNATYALAAIGDARLRRCIDAIQALEMTWLSRQMERKLSRLLDNWSANSDLSNHTAIQLVQEQLASLRSQDVPC